MESLAASGIATSLVLVHTSLSHDRSQRPNSFHEALAVSQHLLLHCGLWKEGL